MAKKEYGKKGEMSMKRSASSHSLRYLVIIRKMIVILQQKPDVGALQVPTGAGEQHKPVQIARLVYRAHVRADHVHYAMADGQNTTSDKSRRNCAAKLRARFFALFIICGGLPSTFHKPLKTILSTNSLIVICV